METWQILIYAVGAVGGGLAGMVFTGVLYYLVCRYILKDPRTLGAVMHVVFANRFKKIQPAYSAAPIIANYPPSRPFRERLEEIKPPVPVVEKQRIPDRKLVEPTIATSQNNAAPIIANYPPSRPFRERLEKIKPILHSPVPVVEKQRMPGQIPVEPTITTSRYNMELKGIVPELIAEFEYNYKIAREFSGGDLVSLQTKIWDTSQHTINTLPGKLQAELENIYGIIRMLNKLVWFSTEFQRHSPALSEQYTNLLNTIADKLKELIPDRKLVSI